VDVECIAVFSEQSVARPELAFARVCDRGRSGIYFERQRQRLRFRIDDSMERRESNDDFRKRIAVDGNDHCRGYCIRGDSRCCGGESSAGWRNIGGNVVRRECSYTGSDEPCSSIGDGRRVRAIDHRKRN